MAATMLIRFHLISSSCHVDIISCIQLMHTITTLRTMSGSEDESDFASAESEADVSSFSRVEPYNILLNTGSITS